MFAILSAIAFFHGIYLCACKYYTKWDDLYIQKRESLVSLCHSTLSSALAMYILLCQHSLFVTPASYSEPIPFCDVVFSISYAYFLWDLIISFAVPHTLDFKIHAVFCTLIYSFATWTPYLHRPAVIVLLFEVSTIFLTSSRIAAEHHKTKCALLSKLLFAATFFIFRILIGSFVTYELWSIFVFQSVDVHHDDVPAWFANTVLFVNALFHCLNIYWFSHIVKVATNTIKKPVAP